MGKLKSALLLLAVAALIGLGVFLPGLALGLMDGASLNRPAAAPLLSVTLATEGADWGPRQALQRLVLQGNLYSVPVYEEVATMTKEEAIAQAKGLLEDYARLGVFLPFEPSFTDAQPYLAIAPYDVETGSVFWGVQFSGEKAPYHSLFLHLEDATGRILHIAYTSDALVDMAPIKNADTELLTAVAGIFFRQLGLDPESFPSLLRGFTVREIAPKKYDESISLEYVLDISEDSRVTVHVAVQPNGFSVTVS